MPSDTSAGGRQIVFDAFPEAVEISASDEVDDLG
jgi:hypothetical protein